jgi:hypothetical protein
MGDEQQYCWLTKNNETCSKAEQFVSWKRKPYWNNRPPQIATGSKVPGLKHRGSCFRVSMMSSRKDTIWSLRCSCALAREKTVKITLRTINSEQRAQGKVTCLGLDSHQDVAQDITHLPGLTVTPLNVRNCLLSCKHDYPRDI